MIIRIFVVNVVVVDCLFHVLTFYHFVNIYHSKLFNNCLLVFTLNIKGQSL